MVGGNKKLKDAQERGEDVPSPKMTGEKTSLESPRLLGRAWVQGKGNLLISSLTALGFNGANAISLI